MTPKISLSFNLRGFRIQAYENDIQILKLCVKYGVEIMLGSDAHREEDVGDFTRTEKILKEVDFPEELIVNLSRENLVQELKRHGKAIAEKMEETL